MEADLALLCRSRPQLHPIQVVGMCLDGFGWFAFLVEKRRPLCVRLHQPTYTFLIAAANAAEVCTEYVYGYGMYDT